MYNINLKADFLHVVYRLQWMPHPYNTSCLTALTSKAKEKANYNYNL